MSVKSTNSRFREIVTVFVKHGIHDGIKIIKDPSKLRMALEELGPTFVKIGQVLSTRPDLLPEPFVNEFQKLQDSANLVPYEEIEQIVVDELKKPLSSLFESFDKSPMASASIAQVHGATLHDGVKVAVKVQRPNIREKMENDIAILRKLAKIVQITLQDSVLNFDEIIDELTHAVNQELDFMTEAEHICRFYENNKQVAYITCPKIFDTHTTHKVLTMEYIKGIKITDIEALEEKNYDPEDIAKKLVKNYFKQIFEDGFFHADPHPGNLLIRNGQIAYIDFGMMASMNKAMREKFNAFLRTVAVKDIYAMMESIMRIGHKKKRINRDALYTDIEDIYDQYIDMSMQDLNLAEMMDAIFKACREHGIAMPRDMVMLLKGLITLESLVAKVASEISIMDVVIPYIKEQNLKNVDIKKETAQMLEDLLLAYKQGIKIPVLLAKLLNLLTDRRLKIQMEHTNLDKSLTDLHKMANRLVFGLIVSSILISSSLIIHAQIGPMIFDVPAMGFIGYSIAVVMGFWLLISILRSGRM